MRMINQPFNGQVGNLLASLLDESEYHSVNIIVAFAKKSGTARLCEHLIRFRHHGGTVNVYVGIDEFGTSYDALCELYNAVDSLYIVHTESSQTFHSKIYDFFNDDKALVIVGSNNLTGGGLWTNVESAVVIEEDGLDAIVHPAVTDYIREILSEDGLCRKIDTPDEIRELLKCGYVKTEGYMRKESQGREKPFLREEREIFAKGIRAGMPKIPTPYGAEDHPMAKKEHQPDQPGLLKDKHIEVMAANFSEKADAIWFETRKLTGGSRNILDLSKTGYLIKGDPRGTAYEVPDRADLMKGGICFFGLEDETQDKIITVRYQGEDYLGNRIIFPSGSVRDNGTWRLQFCGVNAQGRHFTHAQEGYFLVGKIIKFTKIGTDHYKLDVYEESELPRFEETTTLEAHNGNSSRKNSKRMGVILNQNALSHS